MCLISVEHITFVLAQIFGDTQAGIKLHIIETPFPVYFDIFITTLLIYLTKEKQIIKNDSSQNKNDTVLWMHQNWNRI